MTALALVISFLKPIEGLALVKADGLVYPYNCPAGYPTQGYGRVVASCNVPPITKAKAEEWLVEDAQKHAIMTYNIIPSLMKESESRQAAIISFVYNLGPTRLKASTLRQRIIQRNWPEAQKEIKRWTKGRDPKTGLLVDLPGLVKRRALEAQMLGE